MSYLLLLKLIMGSRVLCLSYECEVRKLSKTGPFDIYVGATRAKIFLLCVTSRAEKLEKKVGRKLLVVIGITL